MKQRREERVPEEEDSRKWGRDAWEGGEEGAAGVVTEEKEVAEITSASRRRTKKTGRVEEEMRRT